MPTGRRCGDHRRRHAGTVLPARHPAASLGVDAAVVAVGVDGRGEMAVPEDIRETGWYRFGPAPGSATGSSVVSGHVDDRIQGRGAFYRLVDLAVGDPVIVDSGRGRAGLPGEHRAPHPETALPVDELFARDGPPHLTLVTCGGVFDRASGSYRDNVVVTACPGHGRVAVTSGASRCRRRRRCCRRR